jgi:N-acyl-L-homoserine lactone synthetase
MIDLVLPEARFHFAAPLMQMHHDRKQVFVDRFGWELPARGSWLEVDEYDNEFAVYLLARSADGGHDGSVRLLPSTRPHMLESLFPELCRAGVPRGPDIWEISRLVANPQNAAGGTAVLKVHRLLALALVEFAQLNAISRYTLVAEPARIPALLSVGWPVTPLGLAMDRDGMALQALQIELGENTLAQMRRRLRIEGPVLRLAESVRRAA